MLKIQKSYIDEMVAHASEDDPNECCGLLAGRVGEGTKLYRMTNMSASPHRYDMDGKEMIPVLREIDDMGWQLLAIYHSHTYSPAYPSMTDVRYATWPDASYILISLVKKGQPEVRVYKIDGSRVSEERLQIT